VTVPGPEPSGPVAADPESREGGGEAAVRRETAHTPGMRARARREADPLSARYRDLADEHPILGLPLVFLSRYDTLNCGLLTGSVAFRIFLWLLPVALVMAGVLSVASQDAGGSVKQAAKTAGISGAASQQVLAALKEGHRSWWVAAVIGLAGVLWTGRTLIRTLIVLHAYVWETPRPRQRTGNVLGTALLFVAGFGGLSVITVGVSYLDRTVPVGRLVGTVVEMGLVAVVWVLVTRRLPHRAVGWRDLLPGGVLVAVGITAMHLAGRVYLPNKIAKSSSLYGSLGVAAAILVWLLLAAQLIVSAALLNAVWFDRERAPAPDRP
jgi:membrane protein